VKWACPEADRISRDKSLQRRHLAEYGIPSVRFHEITDVSAALALMHEPGARWVVKPTRAAGSTHVRLVGSAAEMEAVLRDITAMMESGYRNFYDSRAEAWALVEEYLPGPEITLDGVVVDGTFHLGGIHSKAHSTGPTFEEDFYTLPFTDLAAQDEVVGIAERLTASLGLVHCLLNIELRQAADGTYRVVEFSTRISGGHVYRNILDVHAVDLVQAFVRGALGDFEGARECVSERHPGRMATCIKFVYGTGKVVSNHVGVAANELAFRAYYPLAAPGRVVQAAHGQFDICGLLSVRQRFDEASHPAAVRATALRVAGLLSFEVVDPD
jgi:biotin carboxylase